MAQTPNSRRNFLRGHFARIEEDVIRPPQAVADFADRCEGCGKCAPACPQNIIVIAADRRPVVDLTRGECIFCSACAEACPSGALDPALPAQWDWRAQIEPSCLTMNGVTCRSCEDACEPRAIRFRLRPGGMATPIIDPAQCNGCGACLHSCPVGAVNFCRDTVEEAK